MARTSQSNAGNGAGEGGVFADFPPHDLAAERALLGSMMLSQDALSLATEYIRQEDFYDQRHRAVFKVLAHLYEEGIAVDAVTIGQALEETGLKKKVGDIEYVTSLLEEVPSAANVEHYIQLVKERSVRRRILDSATQVTRLVHDPTYKTNDILDRAEQAFYSIASEERTGGVRHISEVVDEVITHLDTLHSQPVLVTGIATGYSDLDEMTSGFHPGEFIIIAGRPSMGKTTFALNLMRNMAVVGKDGAQHPVLLFSLEMTAEQITQNLLCCHSRVDGSKLRKGHIPKETFAEIVSRFAPELYEAPIFIEDQSGLTLSEIRGRARRYARSENIEAIFVDFLQLCKAPGVESREQEIATISRGLKGLAKDLRIPVIALSQLNRNPDARTDRRPMLSDLRESGSIEQDADLVILLHRPDYYDENERPGEIDVILAKNRNGPTGTVHLQYARHLMRMENLTIERG